MFKKHLLALAVLASIGSLPLAQADELAPVVEQQPNLLPPAEPVQSAEAPVDTRWYAAPYGTFVMSGADHVDDHWGGGLAIGKMLNEHFNVEIKGFGETANTNRRYEPNAFYANSYRNNGPYGVDGDVTFAGGTLDLQYYFMRGKFSPYTVIGVGGMDTSVSATLNTPWGQRTSAKHSAPAFIAEAGIGMTYEVLDNLLLRSDIRYRYNNQSLGNFGDTVVGNSQLGSLQGGGSQDVHDMTVNVGVVIPFGAKPKAAEYIAPAPAPTPVADCSTMDSDADGVNDCIDKCPGTMAGSKVDATGCPVKIELHGVNFQYDSAKLTPNAMAILDGVAQNLVSYPQTDVIEVHGYTSSEGSNAHNMRLSQARSESVARYLASKGVTNQLIARGYGESNPVASNSTEQGREQNRRVELIWMGH